MYKCSITSCRFGSEDASRMWNLDRRSTGGELKILCGRHAHEARKVHGLRAFRLSETLVRDARKEQERLEANAFFLAFKKAEGRKARAEKPPAEPSPPAIQPAKS